MKEISSNSKIKKQANTHKIGHAFEDIAVSFLESQGLRVIERNFRTKFAEIDVVAMEKETLCFIEVRSRKSDQFGAPSLSVDFRKQGKIVRAASAYLQRFYSSQPFCRFDIVSICGTTHAPKIEYFRNAFGNDFERGSKRGSPWQVY